MNYPQSHEFDLKCESNIDYTEHPFESILTSNQLGYKIYKKDLISIKKE
jgi:hypothetical protein